MRSLLKIVSLLMPLMLGGTASGVVIPKPLHEGSRVAIISPASATTGAKIREGLDSLRKWGYEPVIWPGVDGRYAHKPGAKERAQQIMEAFADTTIDAIICTRGGFGSTQTIPYLDAEVIRANPKWLVGFSDITALHAYLLTACDMASIHGKGAMSIVTTPKSGAAQKRANTSLHHILSTSRMDTIRAERDIYNNRGTASGILVGGNFATANGLAATPYDPFAVEEKKIIFLEDIDESVHSLERMLTRLHLSGALENANGLIFGAFSGAKVADGYRNAEEMIRYHLKEWGYYDKENFPIVFHFPIGHIYKNMAVIQGSPVTLISGDEVILETN